MTTGWSPNYTSMKDFNHRKSNIAVEMDASNNAKGNWDDMTDQIRKDFLQNIKPSCPPFWSEDEFAVPALALPDIIALLKDKPKRAARTKGTIRKKG
jgi:hypothetical protein